MVLLKIMRAKFQKDHYLIMVKKDDGFEFKLLLIILFKGTFRLHGQEALLMAVLFYDHI